MNEIISDEILGVKTLSDKRRIIPETIFNLFLKIYLIGSMIFWWPGIMAYAPQEMWIQYSAFIFLALSFFVPVKRQISNIYLGLFLLYSIIHTFIFSFTDFSRMALMNIFLGILTIKILAERVDFNFKKIGILFIAFIVANLALLYLQVIDKDPIFTNVNFDKMPQVDHIGFMGARFALGCMAALIIPFLFVIHPLTCILLLPCFYFSKASTTIGAAMISFLYLFWFKNKKIFFILGGLTILLGGIYIKFFDLPTGQFSKRLMVWWAGINVLRIKPWWGYGLGQWNALNFVTVQQNGIPEKWMWAHNEYLQYLFEQGVLGCLFLYAYFKNCFRKFVFNERGRIIFAAFLAFLIISFFHFPWHIGRLTGIGLYIFALVEAHNSEIFNEEIPNSI